MEENPGLVTNTQFNPKLFAGLYIYSFHIYPLGINKYSQQNINYIQFPNILNLKMTPYKTIFGMVIYGRSR